MSSPKRRGSRPHEANLLEPGLESLSAAKKKAVQVSAAQKGTWYVIEAGDLFFVQDTCQLQEWDTLHCKYSGGKII